MTLLSFMVTRDSTVVRDLTPLNEKVFFSVVVYCKIPNISPGLIEVRKHFSRGLYSGGFIFGGHFVLVSEYQDLKNHCFI